MGHLLVENLPETILQVLDHPPITIRISGKRAREQAIGESDDEIDELAEETTAAPARKVPRTRKKRLAPAAETENVQPPYEPSPTRSLSPPSQPPPKKTQGKKPRATKARKGKGSK